MEAVTELLLPLLAAVGLLWLGRLLFQRLVGKGSLPGPVYMVVPAQGDAEALEGQLRKLFWLREGSCRLSVIIADRGLSPEGRAAASALLAQNPGVVLCPAERLGEYIGRL